MLWHKTIGAGGIGGGVSYTFSDSLFIAAPTSPYTFSSANLGTASADRHIVVGRVTRDSNKDASGITVGGVSASLVVRATGTDRGRAEIWIAAVPTGATGDIVITYSSTPAPNDTVFVYELHGFSATAGYTNTGFITSGVTVSTTVNVSGANDLIIAIAGGDSNSATDNISMSGVTMDAHFNGKIEEGDRGEHCSGAHLATSSETGRTISATFDASAKNQIAAAVFAPA